MNRVQTDKRKAERRVNEPEARRERVLAAAQAIIDEKGLRALKVRDVAAAAGTSLGGVYLYFADLDALVIAVSRRTLTRLEDSLAAAESTDPRASIQALARAYLDFAARQPNLVRALFEHRMEADRPFPEDLLTEVTAAFGHIDAPLSRLLADRPAPEVKLIARTMFSGFHGIVTLGIEQRIVAVPLPLLRAQVALFVDAFLDGLTAGSRA